MRFWRFLYRHFIRPIAAAHGTPPAIARGAAIGMAIGFLPFLGLQMIIAAVAATALRANRLVAIALVWISNPLTVAPIFWLDYRVGTKILGIKALGKKLVMAQVGPGGLTDQPGFFRTLAGQMFWPMILGAVVLGLAVGAALYLVTLWALQLRGRRIRRELREVFKNRKLVLASSSPRRRQLLREWGHTFEVVEPDVAEITDSKFTPRKIARHNARRKALAAARKIADPNAIVVAADTLTVLGTKLIGKPRDEADAVRILGELSGTRHSVITALCAIDCRTGRTIVDDDEAFVRMRKLTQQEINDYVKSGEAMGKAGAYAAQETGDKFIKRIDGDIETVVGFPRDVFETMMHRLLAGQKAGKRR